MIDCGKHALESSHQFEYLRELFVFSLIVIVSVFFHLKYVCIWERSISHITLCLHIRVGIPRNKQICKVWIMQKQRIWQLTRNCKSICSTDFHRLDRNGISPCDTMTRSRLFTGKQFNVRNNMISIFLNNIYWNSSPSIWELIRGMPKRNRKKRVMHWSFAEDLTSYTITYSYKHEHVHFLSLPEINRNHLYPLIQTSSNQLNFDLRKFLLNCFSID